MYISSWEANSQLASKHQSSSKKRRKFRRCQIVADWDVQLVWLVSFWCPGLGKGKGDRSVRGVALGYHGVRLEGRVKVEA